MCVLVRHSCKPSAYYCVDSQIQHTWCSFGNSGSKPKPQTQLANQTNRLDECVDWQMHPWTRTLKKHFLRCLRRQRPEDRRNEKGLEKGVRQTHRVPRCSLWADGLWNVIPRLFNPPPSPLSTLARKMMALDWEARRPRHCLLCELWGKSWDFSYDLKLGAGF